MRKVNQFSPEVMEAPETLVKLFAAVDKNKLKFIDDLRKAVSIKSVSTWAETRPEITKMVKWAGDELKNLGKKMKMAFYII